MSLVNLLLPLAGAAGVAYVLKKRTAATVPSALDFATVDTLVPPPKVPEGMPGPMPGGVGVSVHCPPTGSEPAVDVMLAEPPNQPKQSRVNLTQAQALAPALATALITSNAGNNYTCGATSKWQPPKCDITKRDDALAAQVKAFQATVGMVQDGFYGPATAGALMAMLGGAPPPPPFFYGGKRHIKIFRPKAG